MSAAFRLAHEVAEATRAKAGRARQQKSPNELVATARMLERLLAKRRRLRRDLRAVERAITHERRNLRVLAGHFGQHDDPDDALPTGGSK
jgi:phage gp16-like protein